MYTFGISFSSAISNRELQPVLNYNITGVQRAAANSVMKLEIRTLCSCVELQYNGCATTARKLEV